MFLMVSPAVAVSPVVVFSGHVWTVRNYTGMPGPNNWSASSDNVHVDGAGALHLKIKQSGDSWYSSSIHLEQSLGYGVYEYTMGSDLSKQAPNTIVGLFLYADDSHEFDIELGRWSDTSSRNLHYSVQPYSVEGNSIGYSLTVNPGEATYVIDWRPSGVWFYVMSDGKKMAEWKYSGKNNFAPGKERAHINFWQINGRPPADGTDQEVIIKSFKFSSYVDEPVSASIPAPSSATSSPAPTNTSVISATSSVPITTKKLTKAEIKAQKKIEREKLMKMIKELRKQLNELLLRVKELK